MTAREPPGLDAVRAAMHRLFIAAEGARLRREDEKKSVEVAALLGELARALPAEGGCVVDAAAGRSAVGLLAAELLGARELVVIERDPGRVRACEAAAALLRTRAEVTVRCADVGDRAAWPVAPAAVVALHACGPASDAVLDAAVASGARRLLLVPCCYADAVPFSRVARAHADAMGLPRAAAVRRAFVTSLIDAERTLRLEAAGYATEVVPFVAPTVTPHNLLWRARRVGEPRAMADAARRLERLRAGGLGHALTARAPNV